jgi:chromosome segregation protein
MHLTKLSLSGFKSFVDATEVDIPAGLTGIIGPNGCGKSNTVEALRWVMGETSAKRLRGGGMDDVIFAGTKARPARNIAEVRLELNNSDRTAPPPFNDDDHLEIRRRIERGAGSDYTINNKPARARDVQTLLADLASGASSSAMISQGRVAAIVNAKPQERRQILEEAAGVSGLRARRREAELKLQAAETNMTRVDDVVQGLEAQLGTLKKQARQAVRYKELSEKIQRLDGLYLRQEYLRVNAEWQTATNAQNAADQLIAETTATVTTAAAEEANAQASLPELRDAAVRSGAALARIKIADEQLAAEETRIAQQLMQIAVVQQQTAGDIAHQEEQLREAQQGAETISAELATLNTAEANSAQTLADAAARLTTTQETHSHAQQAYDAARGKLVETEAQYKSYSAQVSQLTARLRNLESEATAITSKLSVLTEQLSSDQALISADAAHEEARTAREAAGSHQAQQTGLRAETETFLAEARAIESKAREALAVVQGELNALEKTLADDHEHDEAAIEKITVPAGLEKAIAAALGEAARASLDEKHSSFWRALPDVGTSLPGGLPSLASRIDAPAALRRVLAFVGLAPDAETAARLSAELSPGQMIVTSNGALWRWDGYCVQAGAVSASARRLQQRNRAKELLVQVSGLKDHLATTTAARESAERAFHDADQSMRRAQTEFQAAQSRLEDTQSALTRAREAQSSARQEQAMLGELSRKNTEMQAEVSAELSRTETALAELPAADHLQAAADAAKTTLAAAFDALREAQVAHDQLAFQARTRAERKRELEQQLQQWDNRAASSTARLADLAERIAAQAAEHATIAVRPAEIKEQREAISQQVLSADAAQRAATQALQDAEADLKNKTHALKEAEAALHEAQAARMKLDTQMALAEHKQQELDARAETLANIRAKDLSEHFSFTDEEMKADADEVKMDLERALRSRESIGPVNLRADLEAQELQTQLDTVSSEKAELIAAIARLRGGIGHLNREARERLREAFATVSHHFSELFTRLFNGGTAELKLTDSDDPLEAGLEMFAQPPGKKLQSLQLLSGGEQALTALSLIFAMFKAKPAPICVLDEVDAPLDDANVDRFCTLLEEMAKGDQTRFLVITHHRLTMARMHRLYGVTMREAGVSQMVSVDLNRAVEMVEQQAA